MHHRASPQHRHITRRKVSRKGTFSFLHTSLWWAINFVTSCKRKPGVNKEMHKYGRRIIRSDLNPFPWPRALLALHFPSLFCHISPLTTDLSIGFVIWSRFSDHSWSNRHQLIAHSHSRVGNDRIRKDVEHFVRVSRPYVHPQGSTVRYKGQTDFDLIVFTMRSYVCRSCVWYSRSSELKNLVEASPKLKLFTHFLSSQTWTMIWGHK